MGLLRYRAMLDPQQWKDAYFVLQKSNLFICPLNDGAAEDIINLKRLQELSESSSRWRSRSAGEAHSPAPLFQVSLPRRPTTRRRTSWSWWRRGGETQRVRLPGWPLVFTVSSSSSGLFICRVWAGQTSLCGPLTSRGQPEGRATP